MDNEDFFFDMKDYKLRVVKFKEEEKVEKEATVFIFKLRLETTKTQLEKAFQVYGNIISSSVKKDRKTKLNFGTV